MPASPHARSTHAQPRTACHMRALSPPTAFPPAPHLRLHHHPPGRPRLGLHRRNRRPFAAPQELQAEGARQAQALGEAEAAAKEQAEAEERLRARVADLEAREEQARTEVAGLQAALAKVRRSTRAGVGRGRARKACRPQMGAGQAGPRAAAHGASAPGAAAARIAPCMHGSNMDLCPSL